MGASRRCRLALALVAATLGAGCAPEPPRLLVFHKIGGYPHASIPDGIGTVERLGQEHGFVAEATDDAAIFVESELARFAAVMFLSTTGDVLDYYQQVEFERYIQAGGGFVGVHSATDTEYGWPWYGQLVGARFDSHPQIQPARLQVVNGDHPATAHLDAVWERTDEWYDLREIRPGLDVLIEIDESSYEGATTGTPHPLAWSHAFDGGRAFYTALGHTAESYQEPAFLDHLLGGIRWAMRDGADFDFARARSERSPPESGFRKVVLDRNLHEPMELAMLPEGDVVYIERKGGVKLYRRADDAIVEAGRLEVFSPGPDAEVCSGCEDGLLGVTADPGFAANRKIYLYYSPAGSDPIQRLSRFELAPTGEIDLASETPILEVTVQREVCCHTGGSMTFDGDGNLFLSTGDDVSPFFSDNFTPIDERPGRAGFDAQGSSANTNDLRGKILRITPLPDGGYSIPEGNLFPPGTPGTRPEIYVMGTRNPYRISYDRRSGTLYWGEIGPDAGEPDPARGPRGHDELNRTREPGFFGWPYFVADNRAYRDYDFATGESGPPFDPVAPINDSPNNSGLRELPPARPAFLAYAYDEMVGGMGSGAEPNGRSAMVGQVFHVADVTPGPASLPAYYEGRLFIYEWMRNWIRVVTLDEAGEYLRIEPFMPSTPFHRPMDMEIAPDGSLYVLEYGLAWFERNEDAVLSRIEYQGASAGR